MMICTYLCGFWGEYTAAIIQYQKHSICPVYLCVCDFNLFEYLCHMMSWVSDSVLWRILNCLVLLLTRILQSPAAYVPLDPEAPGLLSARVMTRCGLKYCAVKTDILQVKYFRFYEYKCSYGDEN